MLSAHFADTTRMDLDLEALVARASDSRWIPSIYNYCDRRCARCRFNNRCFSFAEQQIEDRDAPRDVAEVAARSFQRSIALIQAYADRDGIDLSAVPDDSDAEAAAARARRQAARDDPLVTLAIEYAAGASRMLRPLDTETFRRRATLDVRDAVDTVMWLCTMIAPKIDRALCGLVDPSPDDDPVQNDAQGSAKVARLMVADSLAAWRVINEQGRAAVDAETRRLAATLDRIDADLAARFPSAMEFVRPGFDEARPVATCP